MCVYERERFFRIKGERGGEVFIDEFLEYGGSEVSWGSFTGDGDNLGPQEKV